MMTTAAPRRGFGRVVGALLTVTVAASSLALSPVTIAQTGAAGSASAPESGNDIQGRLEDGPIQSGDYRPLVPFRVLDTRELDPADGGVTGGQPLDARQVLDVPVVGVGGVPRAGVAGVVLNLTVTEPTSTGYLTVWPKGLARPTVSNLNYVPNLVAANLVFAKVGDDGSVSIYNHAGRAHVVLDIQGWFAVDSSYHAVVPERIVDTREGLGGSTLTSGGTRDISVLGVGGVPASGVAAVVVNLTAANATSSGFLSVYPAGSARPISSNVNFQERQNVANLVVAKVGVDGKVTIYNHAGFTDIIVDVQGWFADDSSYHPLTPKRIVDTREQLGGDRLSAADVMTVDVVGVAGVPVDAAAVILNVTAAQATEGSFIASWPNGLDRPLSSNLNFTAGRDVANLVVAKVGVDGKVAIYNHSGSTDVVVDIQGWFSDGIVVTGDEYAWRFSPGQVIVERGSTHEVALVQTDDDGQPTGGALPVSTEFETAGDDLSVQTLSDNRIRFTAPDTVGTTFIAAQVPGVTGELPLLTVSVVDFKQGVTQLTDDDIAFPDLDVAPNADIGEQVNDDTDADGVGPFTWAEIAARLDLPDNVSVADLDMEAILASRAIHPVVLRGPAPTTGSIVVGVETTAVLGRVVEPAGLPTIERDGWTLITLELVGPQEAYAEAAYDFSYDDMVALGVAEELPTVSLDAQGNLTESYQPLPRPDAPAGQQRTETDPTSPPPSPPPSSGPPTTAAPTTTVAPVNTQVNGPSMPVRGGRWLTKAADCIDQALTNTKFVASAGEIQPITQFDFKPVFNMFMNIENSTLQDFRIDAGLGVTANAGLGIKFTPKIGFEVACPKLVELARFRALAPGILAPFLSMVADGFVGLKVAVTAEVGPRIEVGFSCGVSVGGYGGFTYTRRSGSTPTVVDTSTPFKCTDKLADLVKVTGGFTDEGIAFGIEATLGMPITAEGAVEIGGVVASSIFHVLSWFGLTDENANIFTVIKAEVSPQVKLAYENAANVIANKGAKSGLFVEVAAKLFLEVKGLGYLSGKLGFAPSGVIQEGLEIPLINTTFAIASLIAPMKSTRLEATVGGENAPLEPSIYVQTQTTGPKDRLVVTSTLSPSGSALTNPLSLQITDGYLYLAGTVPERSTLFGALTPEQSTGAEAAFGKTTLKLDHEISGVECGQLRDTPSTFYLVSESSVAGIPIYGWGGEFKVQCVDGKVTWAEQTVEGLTDQPYTANITTSGRKDDTFTITTAAGGAVPAWLQVTPTTGTIAKKVDGEETVAITLSVDAAVVAQSCTPQTVVLKVHTESRGDDLLTVNQKNPCYVKWTPTDVTGPGTVEATLSQEGWVSEDVDLDALRLGLPDWITTSAAGPLVLAPTDGTPVSTPFTFEVEERDQRCVVQLPRSHQVKVTTTARGSATLRIVDPKVEPFDDCGFYFVDQSLDGGGASRLFIRDDTLIGDNYDGSEREAEWTIETSNLPDWFDVLPTSGILTNGADVQVGFSGVPPSDLCTGRPPVNVPVFATAQMPDNTEREATIVIRFAAVPGADCDPLEGGADGDPHMRSMDGVRWEGQTLGEYVYAQSTALAPTAYRVVVRHQPSNGSTAPIVPTSAFAAALEYGDHRVEVYAAGTSWLYVDGIAVTPAADGVYAVSDQLSYSIDGADIRISSPEVAVGVQRVGILNVTVFAYAGTAMVGMLGSPDGDPSNDFIGADGTPYLANDIVNLAAPAFLDFVNSWRLVDVADSPFTRSYAQFDTLQPIFDPAVLAEYEDEIDTILAEAERICAVPPLPETQRFGLALELSIGTPVDIVSRYLCSYGVRGTATVDGIPVGGLEVTVDAVGLDGCVTTTTADGRYACSLRAQLDELGPGSALPISVEVEGRWAINGVVAANGSASIATLSSVVSAGSSTVVDLAVDPNSLPQVRVEGTILRDGQPVLGDRLLTIEARGVGNASLGIRRVGVSVDDDGSYSVRVALPAGTTAVVASTVVGADVPETFTVVQSVAPSGVTTVPFYISYSLPVVTVSGTLTNGTAGLLGPITVRVTSNSLAGAALPTQFVDVVPDPVSGAISVPVVLPRLATTARASITLAPWNEVYSSLTTNVEPDAVLGLDVVHHPPTVVISGRMVDEGGAGLSPRTIVVSFGPGRSTGVIALPDPTTGVYSVTVVGPVGATAVSANVAAGAGGEVYFLPSTPIVAGDNAITFDVVVAPVVVRAAGTLVGPNGLGLPGPITMIAVFRDIDDNWLTVASTQVTPDPTTGAYSIDLTGHRLARRVELSAAIGVPGETYTQTATGLTGGINPVAFSVAHTFPTLTITGVMTDQDDQPLAGPITMSVVFEGIDGVYQSTANTAANPSAVDGSYSITVTGHHLAGRARVIAFVGANGETVTSTVPSVIAGPNSHTFNVGFSAPTVTVTGTIVDDVGARLSDVVYVRLYGYDLDGDEISFRRVLVAVDTDGRYTFTRTLPTDVVTARAETEIGVASSDWLDSGVLPVSPGPNTFTLSTVYDPPTLTVNGTFTSAPGVPLTGTIQVGVTPRDGEGETLAYVQRGVVPAAGTGAYSFTVTLPIDTVSAEVLPFIGNNGYEQGLDRRTATGFTPGGNVVLDASVVHNPPKLTVSGTALVNGVPTNGFVQVQVAASVPGQPDVFQTGSFPKATNGVYSAALTLPRNATTARITVRAIDGANTFTVDATGLLPNEQRVVTVDFDDVTGFLALGGTLLMLGEPVDNAYLSVTYRAANNGVVGTRNLTVPVDAGGGYALSLVTPNDATTAHVVMSVYGAGLSYSEYLLVPLQPVTTTATFDIDTQQIVLSGTILDGGLPLEYFGPDPDNSDGGPEFRFSVSGPTIDPTTYDAQGVYDWSTGNYNASVVIADGATAVSVDLINTSVDVAPQLATLQPGSNAITWNVELVVTARPMTVVGFVADAGGGIDDNEAEIAVRAFVVDPETATQPNGYTMIADELYPNVEIIDGVFTLPGSITGLANVITIEVRLDPTDRGHTRGFVVAPGLDELILQWSEQRTGIELHTNYDIGGEPPCAATSLLIEVEYWGFPTEPADTSNNDPASWGGGTTFGTILVVPDPADGVVSQVVYLADDSTFVYQETRPWADYGGRFPVSISGTGSIGPGSYTADDNSLYAC
jgi:hypothetical protein